ncbi:MAG: FG-GAP-like repeat-containing protein, partial [Planctomycetota bacterium]
MKIHSPLATACRIASRPVLLLGLSSISLSIPAAGQTAELGALGDPTLGTSGFPSIDIVGGPFVGGRMEVHVNDAAPSSFGYLVIAPTSAPYVLPIGGGVTIYPMTPGVFRFFSTSSSGASGPVLSAAPIPLSVAGNTFVIQAGIRDADALGGWAFTRAVQGRLGDTPVGPVFPAQTHRASANALADFDGDGTLDLAIAQISSNYGLITYTGGVVRRGRGDGTYEPAVRLQPASRSFDEVVAVDVNVDGFMDLLWAGRAHTDVEVDLGNGDGTFSSRAGPGNRRIDRIAVGDLNGDSVPDLALTSDSRSRLELLVGDGTGSFTMTGTRAAPGIRAAQIGDVTDDGFADVVAARGSELVLYTGNGDGTVNPAVVLSSSAFTSFADVAIADVSRDGKPDVVGIVGFTLEVHESLGGGTFAPVRSSGLPFAPVRLALADIDGDGVPDASITNGDSLALLHGRTARPFTWIKTVVLRRPLEGISVHDVNGDSRLDWVVAGAVVLADVRGEPTGERPVTLGIADPAILTTGDFDRDGRLDAVVAREFEFQALLGGNNGIFTPAPQVATSDISGIVGADFDRDGYEELAVTRRVGSAVELFESDAQGVFSSIASVPNPAKTGGLAVGDWNGDGSLDLAVHAAFASTVHLHYGNGDGTFAPVVPMAGDVDLGAILEDNTLIITEAQLLANSTDVDSAPGDLSISNVSVS